MDRVHLLIRGRVQGVWFRQSTKEQAIRLGLKGWVRNLPDGRVEAVAEGNRPELEKLIEWCRNGPPLARVDEVEVEWRKPEKDLPGFTVAF
ncbi:MAG: acylphosphatase [Deltaproteobacteria bacterium]|nr:acylphosphatase [Deltaproteobacteria bacterium]